MVRGGRGPRILRDNFDITFLVEEDVMRLNISYFLSQLLEDGLQFDEDVEDVPDFLLEERSLNLESILDF